MMKRIAIGFAASLLAVTATAGVVFADQAYHTEHLPLSPAKDAPLTSGFVNNIHPNGPQVYAKEVYALKGAEPDTEYTVVLHAYLESTACEGAADLDLPTATFTTNGAGNGKGSIAFAPEDVAGLRGLTIGGRWTVNDATGPAYETACTVVTLD